MSLSSLHFAKDVAQVLQAFEGSARGSIAIEQLIRRLEPFLDEAEQSRLRSFFSRLVGIDCNTVIPKESQHFKSRARVAIQNLVLNEDARKRLEMGLELLFNKLASFLIRVTRRGINDLRELSLITRLDAHKLALEIGHGRELAQQLDGIIDELAENILLVLLIETASAFQASGTDMSMVSGLAWAARGTRSEYLSFLHEPLENLRRQYPEWFSHADFEKRLLELREPGETLVPAVNNRTREPLVACIVLGLLFDALVVHDIESAKTLAFFLFDEAFVTNTENLLSLAPEIFRMPLQLETETSRPEERESLIIQCRESFNFFSRRREFALKQATPVSDLRLNRDIFRLTSKTEERILVLRQLFTSYAGSDIATQTHASDSIFIENESAARTRSRRNATRVPVLPAAQKIMIINAIKDRDRAIEEVAVTLIELLGLTLRDASTIIEEYFLVDLAYEIIEMIESSSLRDALRTVVESEFRFAFLATRGSTFPALRVLERFGAEQRIVELLQSSRASRGSAAIILEGVGGQLFSQDTRYRIYLFQHEKQRKQLSYCWKETEKRIHQELRAHRAEIDRMEDPKTSLEETMASIRALDASSRRRSCLAVSLELLALARDAHCSPEAETIVAFIEANLLEESNAFQVHAEKLLDEAADLQAVLSRIERASDAATEELLLSGSGPELAIRFQKDPTAAQESLSNHFMAAARVARRSILPARALPFQKLEIAMRYAEVFELIEQSALRIG